MAEAGDCLVVVQVRLGSTRLPAKALLPLGAMASFVLCARRAANTGLRVVVATSSEAIDDSVAAAADAAGLAVARGPLDDVLGRYALACRDLPDTAAVVRLTADNVVPDGAFVTMLLERFRRLDLDYLGTSSPVDCLPYGLSAEVFSAAALRRAEAQATSAFDREHVTPWIRRTARSRTYRHEGAPASWSRLRCTLDSFDDYLRLQRLLDAEPQPLHAPWQVLVERLDRLREDLRGPRCPYRLGQDGAVNSVLTLGTAQIGMPYGIANRDGLPDDDAAAALLDAAVEGGITTLDTARAYGLAEERIGRLLSPGQRARVRVITKLDPLAEIEADATPGRVRDAVDASVLRSLHALRTRSIDTLLLHRWSHHDAWGGAAWKRLLQLRAEGLIDRLGASVSCVDDALAALAEPEVLHLQCPVNVVDARWRAPRLKAALAARPEVMVHARSALLQGLLTLPAHRWPEVAHYDRTALAALLDDGVARLRREDRVDLCMAYVRGLPWVHSIVIGTENREQLRRNLELARRPALEAGQLASIEQSLPALPEAVVDPARWSTA